MKQWLLTPLIALVNGLRGLLIEGMTIVAILFIVPLTYVSNFVTLDAWWGFGPVVPGTTTGRTVWDWLTLLGAPIFVAYFVARFTFAQQKRDQEQQEQRNAERERSEAQHAAAQAALEEDHRREAALQAYLAAITTIALPALDRPDALAIWSDKGHPRVALARAQTRSVFARLDRDRQVALVRFLAEDGMPGADAWVRLNGLTWDGADISAMRFVGARLTNMHLRRARALVTDFTQATIYDCDLRDSVLSGARFHGAVLIGVQWQGAIMLGTKFIGAEFGSTADLAECDLGGVDFSQAALLGVDLRGAHCVRTTFVAANLDGACATDMHAPGADFTSATLISADLINARCIGANFTNVDFTGAILNNADFTGAVLTGAMITRAQLAQVATYADAVLPATFAPDPAPSKSR